MASTDGSTRPGMRRLLFIAGVLVAIAGIQLFVMTERTAAYFAWTIAPPKNLYLTAAFVGAAYWASACLEIVAARETDWSVLRLSIPAVFTFTSLTLLYTLIHIDLFHLGTPLGAPATGMALQAAVLGALGVALFVRPALAPSLWPWALTPLTARSIATWLIAFAVAAVAAVRANDLRRVRGPIVAYLALGILQLAAVARYAGEVDWGSAGMWAYTAFLVGIVGSAGCAMWVGRGGR